MAKAYQHDSKGFYLGESEDYGGPLPNNAVKTAPKLSKGFIPRWNGKTWKQVETHKGKSGYVNGEPITIKNHGPLPEGWSDEFIDPRSSGEIRKEEIERRLSELDKKKIRSLSELIMGDSEEGKKILAELNAESQRLREENAALA